MTRRWSSTVQHHPVRKKFQCKNIPDEMMIRAIQAVEHDPSRWKMRWDVEKELRKLLGDDAPEVLTKVMMAKFDKMERRGMLHGCSCGCRGDYHLPDEAHFCC
jgi:hypothetical protein